MEHALAKAHHVFRQMLPFAKWLHVSNQAVLLDSHTLFQRLENGVDGQGRLFQWAFEGQV